jgi:thiamine-phosphate pyrophosphorylase
VVAGADASPAALAAAVAGGADRLQLRARTLPARALLAWCDAVAAAVRGAGGGRRVTIVVNRRIDVALAAGADGVHLGFDGLDPSRARALVGPGRLVGVSAHAVAELAPAAAAGADYAHLAPIFDPFSKAPGRPPLGLAALAAARGAGLPVLAQGGIDAARAAAAVRAGAAGAAVTGAVLGAADPQAAARALRAALDAAAGAQAP